MRHAPTCLTLSGLVPDPPPLAYLRDLVGRVLVHGDACLPNFLCVGRDLSAYIDVGDMALGEPETDLAAAVWSLHYNLGAEHGLAFLREYGVIAADEGDVERLRLNYEQQ